MPTSHYSSNNVPYKYSGWAVYRCFNLEFYSGCIDKLGGGGGGVGAAHRDNEARWKYKHDGRLA